MEKPGAAQKPNAAPTPTLEQRRAANAAELERLRGVEAELKLPKRDLLHSDTEGSRVYAIDLAVYNEALVKAPRRTPSPARNRSGPDRLSLERLRAASSRNLSESRP